VNYKTLSNYIYENKKMVNTINGDIMKKLYKFGYISGWFLLFTALFFIFTLIFYFNKVTFFGSLCSLIVIILSIRYFVNNVIYVYNYTLRGSVLFIYRKTKPLYQIDLKNIDIDNGFFDVEKKLIFSIKDKDLSISIDYDNEVLQKNFEKGKYNRRKKWYLVLFIMTFIIVTSIIYVIIKHI